MELNTEIGGITLRQENDKINVYVKDKFVTEIRDITSANYISTYDFQANFNFFSFRMPNNKFKAFVVDSQTSQFELLDTEFDMISIFRISHIDTKVKRFNAFFACQKGNKTFILNPFNDFRIFEIDIDFVFSNEIRLLGYQIFQHKKRIFDESKEIFTFDNNDWVYNEDYIVRLGYSSREYLLTFTNKDNRIFIYNTNSKKSIIISTDIEIHLMTAETFLDKADRNILLCYLKADKSDEYILGGYYSDDFSIAIPFEYSYFSFNDEILMLIELDEKTTHVIEHGKEILVRQNVKMVLRTQHLLREQGYIVIYDNTDNDYFYYTVNNEDFTKETMKFRPGHFISTMLDEIRKYHGRDFKIEGYFISYRNNLFCTAFDDLSPVIVNYDEGTFNNDTGEQYNPPLEQLRVTRNFEELNKTITFLNDNNEFDSYSEKRGLIYRFQSTLFSMFYNAKDLKIICDIIGNLYEKDDYIKEEVIKFFTEVLETQLLTDNEQKDLMRSLKLTRRKGEFKKSCLTKININNKKVIKRFPEYIKKEGISNFENIFTIWSK